MNTIFFINYQREIPPFMITELQVACRLYDRVYYTSPSLTNASLFPKSEYPNLRFLLSESRFDRMRQYLSAAFFMFTPEFWREMRICGRSVAIAKALCVDRAVAKGLELLIDKPISKEIRAGSNVTVVACWFSVLAVVAADLKKRYPQIKAVSLAHAFEIDAKRNIFRNRSFIEHKLEHLDAVHFISSVKLAGFYESLDEFKIRERFGNKIDVVYLGSTNPGGSLNPMPKEREPLHILTCSRTSPEKRLERLTDALKLWNNGPLTWTHIGSGPLDEKIHALAAELQQQNPLVTVRFEGYKPNAEVKQWLKENAVHLFVNVSDTEGLPVSVMEAASFGIPCAATDVGGTRELISPEMGWLEPAEFSGDSFIKRLSAFARLSTECQAQMRKEAFRVWNEKFNAAITRPRFYKSMLASKE